MNNVGGFGFRMKFKFKGKKDQVYNELKRTNY